jgi:hypothetical protein
VLSLHAVQLVKVRCSACQNGHQQRLAACSCHVVPYTPALYLPAAVQALADYAHILHTIRTETEGAQDRWGGVLGLHHKERSIGRGTRPPGSVMTSRECFRN